MYQSLPIDDNSLRIIRDKLKEHQDSIDLFGFKISNFKVSRKHFINIFIARFHDSFYNNCFVVSD